MQSSTLQRMQTLMASLNSPRPATTPVFSAHQLANHPPTTAPELLLKVILTGTLAHFSDPFMIDDKRLEHLLQAGKQILYKSHQESETRQNLGFSPRVWEGLTEVVGKAVLVLENMSCSWKTDALASHANANSSSDLIAANYFALVKDIERLNDLCTIARNLLATTKKAQNLAAEKGFDQQILKLIDVCVRVTARGFDGETNARNEERWQKVVNLYKRLLITCLQFLHNFIMHNEQRKLVLWLDLFGNAGNSAPRPSTTEPVGQLQDKAKTSEDPALQEAREARIKATADKLPEGDQRTEDGGLGYNIDDVHALFEMMNADGDTAVETKEAAKILMNKIRADMEKLSGLNSDQLDSDPEALFKVGAALREKLPEKDFPRLRGSTMQSKANNEAPKAVVDTQPKPLSWSDLPEIGRYGEVAAANLEITADDMTMPRSSQSAADTLQEAKNELMQRLQETGPLVEANGEQLYDIPDNPDGLLEDDILDSADDSLEDEEEEEEDYRSPGDQERGLLTDVPLVLGPTEIEALPMIIQAGIVDNFGSKAADKQGARNMQAVRCHILLAQEAGRNVLRELLIFIAAWDLPDDEFYFKMMMQIMEAILKNGLMSHAYSDFGQAKDIISPAQAVVVKLLTHIFRAKYSPASMPRNANDATPPKPRIPAALSRVDILTVRYIFTVFRGNIIPETCALIYLQGQIKAGHALAEDFPLNLWDMERVYEGVYQFLEFFAVLTENSEWKSVLVEWELAYDLCTLIKELDESIPRAPFMPTPNHNPLLAAMGGATNATATGPTDSNQGSTTPVAVERPYSPTIPPTTSTDTAPTQPPSPPPPLSPTDPSTFEWRNLKKLIVLVLSSLVWKCSTAQNQIRVHGGIEPILQCTLYDGHNPYIREHAVVCLKFLLEGNAENQDIVRQLEARGIAGQHQQSQTGHATGGTHGQEILDGLGVRAELGDNGRVKLVRRSSDLGINSGGAGSAGARTLSENSIRERLRGLDLNPLTAGGGTTGRVIGEEQEEEEELDDGQENEGPHAGDGGGVEEYDPYETY